MADGRSEPLLQTGSVRPSLSRVSTRHWFSCPAACQSEQRAANRRVVITGVISGAGIGPRSRLEAGAIPVNGMTHPVFVVAPRRIEHTYNSEVQRAACDMTARRSHRVPAQ